jgi:hypothetical protein
VETKIESLVKDEVKINEALKGEEITFICEQEIRPRDQVYRVFEVETNAANNVKLI